MTLLAAEGRFGNFCTDSLQRSARRGHPMSSSHAAHPTQLIPRLYSSRDRRRTQARLGAWPGGYVLSRLAALLQEEGRLRVKVARDLSPRLVL